MSLFGNIFRGREPTNSIQKSQPDQRNVIKMITTYSAGDTLWYQWDGKLYNSDIVRSVIRPIVKTIGKMEAKHIRTNQETGEMTINPENRIKLLMERPNPFMTGQLFREKMCTQLLLNSNAFALIVRNQWRYPVAMYPIPCVAVEAIYDEQANLYLKFTYKNGKMGVFAYEDILHLRTDFNDEDIFGTSPASALASVMECVGVIDQGLVKAVKNSNIIRWLLNFNSNMRPEDLKKQTDDFAKNYLSYETDSFGVASTDLKATATQIKPYDYVPNALTSDRIYDRIHSFFNTNKNITQSDFDEDQWNAFYEMVIQPIAIQFSDVLTDRIFTWREQVFGNKILLQSAALLYASLKTKLGLTQFLDRGILNANEIRAVFSLASIPGGDIYVRRLDTAPTTVQTAGGSGDGQNTPEQEQQNPEQEKGEDGNGKSRS